MPSLLPTSTSPGQQQQCAGCANMSQGDNAPEVNHADAMDGWCRAWLVHVKRNQVCGRWKDRDES